MRGTRKKLVAPPEDPTGYAPGSPKRRSIVSRVSIAGMDAVISRVAAILEAFRC